MELHKQKEYKSTTNTLVIVKKKQSSDVSRSVDGELEAPSAVNSSSFSSQPVFETNTQSTQINGEKFKKIDKY